VVEWDLAVHRLPSLHHRDLNPAQLTNVSINTFHDNLEEILT